jgi:hypothetical protein
MCSFWRAHLENTNLFYDINDSQLHFVFILLYFYQWFNMLSRLVGRCASVIWLARLSIRWMNHSFGRRVVMPLPTPYTLLGAHNAATVTSRASRAQSTATAKVPTASLPRTTLDGFKQEMFMLSKDLIFTNLRDSSIDY